MHRYVSLFTWLAGCGGSSGSPCLTLAGWVSLMASPADSPLVWPGEFFSMTGILSSTAALWRGGTSQLCTGLCTVCTIIGNSNCNHNMQMNSTSDSRGAGADISHLKNRKCRLLHQAVAYLMWSYFLNRALYSTALCCSSTSIQLP